MRGLAALTIDGLPNALLERIVESAAANHRSIVGEVIARLETAFGSARPPADSMLARVRAVRSRLAVAPAAPALDRRVRGFSSACPGQPASAATDPILPGRLDPGAP